VKQRSIVLLLATGALAVAQPIPKPDALADGGSYTDLSGVKVQILGACSVSADSIDCWDLQGHSSQTLSERVRPCYEGQNGQLYIRFHKKNRLIVSSVTNPQGGYGSVQIQDLSGQYIQGLSFFSDGTAIASGLWSGSKDQKTLDVVATLYNLPGAPPIDVPFVKGQKFSVGGLDYEIGDYHLAPAEPGRDGSMGGPNTNLGLKAKQKQWRILIGYAPYSGTSRASFSAIQGSDLPTLYVNKNGKPMSPLEAAEEQAKSKKNPGPVNGPGYPMYPGYPYGGPTAFCTPTAQNGVITLQTNIDPRTIAKLRVSTTGTKSVLFKDIPLDPAP
jgi:hypothetical protein